MKFESKCQRFCSYFWNQREWSIIFRTKFNTDSIYMLFKLEVRCCITINLVDDKFNSPSASTFIACRVRGENQIKYFQTMSWWSKHAVKSWQNKLCLSTAWWLIRWRALLALWTTEAGWSWPIFSFCTQITKRWNKFILHYSSLQNPHIDRNYKVNSTMIKWTMVS